MLASREAQAAQPAQAVSASEASSVAGAGWVQDLEAGRITRQQAIEGLVADAIEAHGGAQLSPAARAELEQVLRAALVEDPVLSGLLGG